jgi:hypothetical protein
MTVTNFLVHYKEAASTYLKPLTQCRGGFMFGIHFVWKVDRKGGSEGASRLLWRTTGADLNAFLFSTKTASHRPLTTVVSISYAQCLC